MDDRARDSASPPKRRTSRSRSPRGDGPRKDRYHHRDGDDRRDAFRERDRDVRDRERDRDRERGEGYRRGGLGYGDRERGGFRNGERDDYRDRDRGGDRGRDRDAYGDRGGYGGRDSEGHTPRGGREDRDAQDRGGKPRRAGGGGFRWKEKRGEDTRDSRPRSRSPRRDRDREPRDAEDRDRKRKKDKKSTAAGASSAPPKHSGEPMIVVHVNDRLGTKAAIPCFASDRIKEFKILVAARVGREPHEILLKRQGERPFKDQLTLEDYGVSNGVQLDLEVDTGD